MSESEVPIQIKVPTWSQIFGVFCKEDVITPKARGSKDAGCGVISCEAEFAYSGLVFTGLTFVNEVCRTWKPLVSKDVIAWPVRRIFLFRLFS